MPQLPAQPRTDSGHRYLRPQDLRRLRHLFFAPRRPVEGRYAGRHASTQRGHSVEFNDYRPYVPGDEISDIDWKVYGRSDRLFIKLFEHQADMSVHLLIDASASMAYRGLDHKPADTPLRAESWLSQLPRVRTRRRATADPLANPSKYDYACLLAAAIAFLLLRQQDKAGLTIAQTGLARFIPSQGSFTHLRQLLRTMEHTQPAGEANLAQALEQLARRAGRRSVLILFSDLYEPREPILRALAAFAHRGNQAIVFHVLHADEFHLPDLPQAMFIDSETGQRLRLNVAELRRTYQERLKQHLAGWSAALLARGIDHNVVSTATPYARVLERYLFRPARMR